MSCSVRNPVATVLRAIRKRCATRSISRPRQAQARDSSTENVRYDGNATSHLPLLTYASCDCPQCFSDEASAACLWYAALRRERCRRPVGHRWSNYLKMTVPGPVKATMGEAAPPSASCQHILEAAEIGLESVTTEQAQAALTGLASVRKALSPCWN